jgi:hypothetical protein
VPAANSVLLPSNWPGVTQHGAEAEAFDGRNDAGALWADFLDDMTTREGKAQEMSTHRYARGRGE